MTVVHMFIFWIVPCASLGPLGLHLESAPADLLRFHMLQRPLKLETTPQNRWRLSNSNSLPDSWLKQIKLEEGKSQTEPKGGGKRGRGNRAEILRFRAGILSDVLGWRGFPCFLGCAAPIREPLMPNPRTLESLSRPVTNARCNQRASSSPLPPGGKTEFCASNG